jgi:hypothetical protein
MHSTKTATTIAKVNSDEPKESPPIRISTVWSVIMAKPVRNAAPAKAAKPSTRTSASGGGSGGAADARRPRATKMAPAARFTTAIATSAPARPRAGTIQKPAASAPAKAPVVLKPYTRAWVPVASSRLRARACVSIGIVPPMRTAGGRISSADSATSNAKPGPPPKGRRKETAWAASNRAGNSRA